MAFPLVTDRATYGGFWTGYIQFTVPAGDAGDLILVMSSTGVTPWIIGDGAGFTWTQMSPHNTWVGYQIDTAGTISGLQTVTTGYSNISATAVWRIAKGTFNPATPVGFGPTTGGTWDGQGGYDPPAMTAPWGSGPALWIPFAKNSGNGNVGAYPPGFTQGRSISNTVDYVLAVCELSSIAETVDPGLFIYAFAPNDVGGGVVAVQGVGSGGGFGAFGL
jgi:hypothetical protein